VQKKGVTLVIFMTFALGDWFCVGNTRRDFQFTLAGRGASCSGCSSGLGRDFNWSMQHLSSH